jgi:hypothetical protein
VVPRPKAIIAYNEKTGQVVWTNNWSGQWKAHGTLPTTFCHGI